MQAVKLSFWKNAWPGLLASVGLALIAIQMGTYVYLLGGAGCGLLLGVTLASLLKLPARLKPGFSAAGKQILQLAIILLGAGLNLVTVRHAGFETLSLLLVIIAAVFVAAYAVGRVLQIPVNNRNLIASGTAICGGSAIAAIAPIIGAKDEEVSYSISVVFLFNLAAVAAFPLFGRAFGLSPEIFGVWAGAAVNDTSSVMAASFAFDAASVPVATLVKMTRTVLIIPMALFFSLAAAVRVKKAAESGMGGFSFVRVFPWFVLFFFLMSLGTTLEYIPVELASSCQVWAKFLITVALSGIGLNTDLRKILAAGSKPILLGACLWFVAAVLGLVLANQ
ncbi:MAG: putative sulfate exporter family transporter [Planctomycetes bacterium]|nr:putative sulfate exporter family transporter [Planctomycetota bacterium]